MKLLLCFFIIVVFAGCGKDLAPKPLVPVDITFKDTTKSPTPPPPEPDSLLINPDTAVTTPVTPAPPVDPPPNNSTTPPAPPIETVPVIPPAPVETVPVTPPSTPPIINGKAYFFGDSITEGYDGKSVNAKNWAALLSQAMGWEGHNLGIGGSTLEKTSNGVSVAKNMYNRVSEIPQKGEGDKYLFFAYGINDAAYNFYDLTVTQFTVDYQFILDVARSKGWQGNDIVIINIYYCNAAALFRYSDPLGIAHGRLATFNAAINAIADTNGTHLIDIYSYMKENGADQIVSADGVHPSEAGYAVIARGIEKAIRGF
jgi:lysophospholipase L1-like esterase